MKKMLKTAAVLAAMVMALALAGCFTSIADDDGIAPGGGNEAQTPNDTERDDGAGDSEYTGLVIENGVVTKCDSNATGHITIPEGVTSIGKEAFSNCSSLASVTIPDSVESIGDGAFKGCASLATVTIGNGVESIGDGAFNVCTSLASVTIPGSVTSIGEGAFARCTSLASVTIGDGVESIGNNAFNGCAIKSVEIPASVNNIGNTAFDGCTSLKEVKYGGTEEQWRQIAMGASPFPSGVNITDKGGNTLTY